MQCFRSDSSHDEEALSWSGAERGIAMKGSLYDRSTEVLAREKEVILQPGNQGLVKGQIDSAAVLNSTGQILYGYSVDGSRTTHKRLKGRQ